MTVRDDAAQFAVDAQEARRGSQLGRWVGGLVFMEMVPYSLASNCVWSGPTPDICRV